MSSSYPTEPAGGPNEGVDHPSSNHESDDRLYPTRTAENYNRSTLSTIVLGKYLNLPGTNQRQHYSESSHRVQYSAVTNEYHSHDYRCHDHH